MYISNVKVIFFFSRFFLKRRERYFFRKNKL